MRRRATIVVTVSLCLVAAAPTAAPARTKVRGNLGQATVFLPGPGGVSFTYVLAGALRPGGSRTAPSTRS
jgi:hypothetical protein